MVAETHSPPHIQRSSLALVIEAGGDSEAGRGSEEVETKEKTKKVSGAWGVFQHKLRLRSPRSDVSMQ